MARVSDHRSLDPAKVGLFAFQVFSKLEGAVTAGMIHLGDRLGLYRALAEADRPRSTVELADELGFDERWVREWAFNQAAAHIVEMDADERLSLSPEAVAVLASPDHPSFGMGSFHHLPKTMATLERLPEAFRTGVGLAYDEHGPDCAEGIARGFEPWMRANLIDVVLPALEGVTAKLAAGARVADVGCGAGGVALLLASRFPTSEIWGYDISQHALDRARARQGEARIANVHFLDPRESSLPADGSLDLVTTFDCIHDMTQPAEVMAAIRGSLADDGTWLLVDIKAYDTFADNAERNPMASLMYGISVLSCMSSALSEPGGAGLGTLGLSAARAEQMSIDAGFTRFRRIDVDHPVNAFYEVRP